MFYEALLFTQKTYLFHMSSANLKNSLYKYQIFLNAKIVTCHIAVAKNCTSNFVAEVLPFARYKAFQTQIFQDFYIKQKLLLCQVDPHSL